MPDAPGTSRPADPRTNTTVKVVLRAGLALALTLLVVGLVVQLAGGHDQAQPVRMFSLLAPRPAGEKIMGVGTLVLALTPAIGVLTVVLNWARERDHKFVGVGALVITVLAAAVGVGLLRVHTPPAQPHPAPSTTPAGAVHAGAPLIHLEAPSERGGGRAAAL